MHGFNINAVIVDSEEKSTQAVRSALADIPGIHIVGYVQELTKAFDVVKTSEPQLVVLNLFPLQEEALDLAERITQEFRNTTVFVSSPEAKPETIIKAMRAGAREFLIQPIKKNELDYAAKLLLNKVRKAHTNGKPESKIITVFGAKGGVGTTTIATSLATALSTQKKKNVMLMDLNFKLGNISLFLNIKPTFSMLDIANNINDIDYEMLKKSLPTHASGVRVLTGPTHIEDAEVILPAHVEQILTMLKYHFDVIVIDIPPTFDDVSLTAMDQADTIFVVSTMELAAIYNTKSCLNLFSRLGYNKEKVKLLLNRYPSPPRTVQQELEKTFGYPVLQRIPNDNYRAVSSTIHKGEPFSALTSESKFRLGMLELAASLNGHVENGRNGTVGKKISFWKKMIKG